MIAATKFDKSALVLWLVAIVAAIVFTACVVTGFAWLIIWLIGVVTAGAVVLAFWQGAAIVGLLLIVGAFLKNA